jgi:hypothetical protein
MGKCDELENFFLFYFLDEVLRGIYMDFFETGEDIKFVKSLIV